MLLRNIKVPAQQVSFLDAVRIGLGEQQGLFFPASWPKSRCRRAVGDAVC